MPNYWVYENFPTNKAILHFGSCSHCNDGNGRLGFKKADNGFWHGPFAERWEAQKKQEGLGKKITRSCMICDA